MRKTYRRSKYLATLLAVGGMLSAPALPGYAQSAQGGAASSNSAPPDNGQHTWTEEQIVTSSARECWMLSGRNEQNFFEIVKALAELSATKRGVQLPETKEAGMAAGNWIKTHAKADPNQLLYVIVDQAVQRSAAHTAAKTAAAAATPQQ